MAYAGFLFHSAAQADSAAHRSFLLNNPPIQAGFFMEKHDTRAGYGHLCVDKGSRGHHCCDPNKPEIGPLFWLSL
jgi:hypothetical protein